MTRSVRDIASCMVVGARWGEVLLNDQRIPLKAGALRGHWRDCCFGISVQYVDSAEMP